MKFWLGFKSVVWISGLIGFLLLAIWILISQNYTEIITPSAQTTGETFLRALAAHRFEGALNELSSGLEGEVTTYDLKVLMEHIERAHHTIDRVSAVSHSETGELGSARVEVRFSNGVRRTLDLPMRRENGIWKISSLKPVWDFIFIYRLGREVSL